MLSQEQRARLLQVARQSLRHAVGAGPGSSLESDDPDLRRPSGAFVTLKAGGNLRGCIGHIEPVMPLIETVSEMAVAAALDDPRFPAVSRREEPGLRIEISVMSPIEPVPDLAQIEVGRHGLVVQQGSFRGLLLPQVAPEWGWDREELLRHTCRKAGLPDDAYLQGAKVFWFEAEVFGEDE
jgi:AmmeMemoRadiSam system protein A